MHFSHQRLLSITKSTHCSFTLEFYLIFKTQKGSKWFNIYMKNITKSDLVYIKVILFNVWKKVKMTKENYIKLNRVI